MRLHRRLAQSTATVVLVLGVVSLEPGNLRVTLEREDVRGDAVQEPTVVRDHQHATGKVQDGVFKRAQSIDIQVVGRLVQKQHVSARF